MAITSDAQRPLGQFQVGMTSFFPFAVFATLLALSLAVALALGQVNERLGVTVGAAGTVLSALFASAIKVANQWERAIVLRLGQFRGTRGPGLFVIIPVMDRVRLVDTRLLTEDIRRQEVITRDNVPVSIDGVLFFRVINIEDAVMKIQDYFWGITQLALTALRDVVGGVTLDELLAERERIGKLVREIVDKQAQEWGLEVTLIRLQQIDMPEELKKIMSRQAAAEREKRATITKAEGDRLAAENLAAAAATMAVSPGVMQLRTLQTIDGLGPSASNTVVLAVPIEIIEMVKRVGQATSPRSLVVPVPWSHSSATGFCLDVSGFQSPYSFFRPVLREIMLFHQEVQELCRLRRLPLELDLVDVRGVEKERVHVFEVRLPRKLAFCQYAFQGLVFLDEFQCGPEANPPHALVVVGADQQPKKDKLFPGQLQALENFFQLDEFRIDLGVNLLAFRLFPGNGREIAHEPGRAEEQAVVILRSRCVDDCPLAHPGTLRLAFRGCLYPRNSHHIEKFL